MGIGGALFLAMVIGAMVVFGAAFAKVSSNPGSET